MMAQVPSFLWWGERWKDNGKAWHSKNEAGLLFFKSRGQKSRKSRGKSGSGINKLVLTGIIGFDI